MNCRKRMSSAGGGNTQRKPGNAKPSGSVSKYPDEHAMERSEMVLPPKRPANGEVVSWSK